MFTKRFSQVFNATWWDYTLYLMVRMAAQTGVGAILANQAGWFTHWYETVISIGTMVLLSFLTSILTSPVPKQPDDTNV